MCMNMRHFFWGSLGCVAISFLLAVGPASGDGEEETATGVSEEVYSELMASEVLDVQDLAEGAEIQRRMFNRMTPPGAFLVQPMFPSVAPFDAANFDATFLENLLGEDKNSVAIYPLSLALDPATRETLVRNAEGKLIATLPAETVSRVWAADADPARVVLKLDLLPAEDVEPYLYAEDRIEEGLATRAARLAKPPRTGEVALKSLGAGQFGFAGIRSTNGSMRITVSNGMDGAEIYSYTVLYTSALVVAIWTNDENEVVTNENVVWTPVSPPYDGIESGWECRTTNLLFTDGAAVWEDADVPSNALVRFYAAAQPMDADEDGLNDGAEILLHRTDPGMADTDGDGMPDGWEVEYGLEARSGLDPSMACWWKFDDGEGTNALNSAMDCYHGELRGFSGATNSGWTEEGKFGGALAFDGGDDWVRIAQDVTVLTGGAFTVSAWAHLDGSCTSDWPEVISDIMATTYDGYCLGFGSNGVAYAMVGASGWAQDTNALVDQWVWLALEFDGTNMSLYRNGELVRSLAPVSHVPATNGYFAIGDGQDPGYSEHWKGRIDDVRIYRSAIGTNALAGMYDAVEDGDLDDLTNLQEYLAGTNPHDADTDGDGISDGEDPYPVQPNQEPIVRFRHPPDGQTFYGPAQMELSSEWIYGTQAPSQVVYRIESMIDGSTNEFIVPAGNAQTTNWYAPPGIFRLTARGVDGTGQTGETNQVDIVLVESETFAALTAAEKQAVLENGPRAVDGVEEWAYGYSTIPTGSLSSATSGSRIFSGFVRATNFTVVPVSNSYLSVDYHDRDLMYADVTNNAPTTNLTATLYGVTRWGSRVEANLPPPAAAPRSWPAASDTFLVFDQNERGDWVGKVYPSLNNLGTNYPFALLQLGTGSGRDAYFYRNGSYQVLYGPTNFNGEDDYRLVFGLNNEGIVVGAGLDYEAHGGGMYLGLEEFRPIVYGIGQTGTVLSVSTQAVGGTAYAVNDKGIVVGCEISTNEVPRAVKWVGGVIEAVGGLTGAEASVAFDVSEDGAIAGMQRIDGQWRPFLADAASAGDVFSSASLGGIDFAEFWHVGKFGALGWGGSNSAQRLYWVVPDDDQDGFSDIVEQEIVDAEPYDELTNIVDVAAGDDFDGDGLTNLQEWEAQTDPVLRDSDGDRIPDGTDPLSMTRRDRDGDGLPDDWEDFYNLDPLSTNGTDGATGDPDGDGINNLEEFQLGGNPNSPADLGYVFHREKIEQLRVALPDSIYCGGTNDHPPESVARCITFLEVTDPNLPPTEFTFKVSVTGWMEVHGFGYNCVRVNDQTVFTGPDEGFAQECEMTNKTGYVLVKLNTSYIKDWICIEYLSLGMHHSNAWAAVTDIELVDVRTNVHSLKVEIEDSSTDNFSPQLGEDATINVKLAPTPPSGGFPDMYFECEIVRALQGGSDQHIQWIDVDPSVSGVNLARGADFSTLALTWNGIPAPSDGNASQATGPETFTGVLGTYNRILPAVTAGQCVPPPLYYAVARLKYAADNSTLCEARRAIYVPQVVAVSYTTEAINLLMTPLVVDTSTVVSAFSAADIDQMKASIEADVAAYYGGQVNLRFGAFSSLSAPYGTMSIELGTGSSPDGLAYTDFGNAECSQTAQAFVYRHRLDCAMEYALNPTNLSIPVLHGELSTFLGLTASHEIGHTLGLVKQNAVLDGYSDSHNKLPWTARQIMNPGVQSDSVAAQLGRNGLWSFKAINHSYLEFVLPIP